MKTLYGALLGFVIATIIMVVSFRVAYYLKIDINNVKFLIGWISCMGYYIGIDLVNTKNDYKNLF